MQPATAAGRLVAAVGGENLRVDHGGIALERQDAACKILAKHRQRRYLQPAAAAVCCFCCFLQGISSKRPCNPLLRADFAAEESAFCRKRTANNRPLLLRPAAPAV